MLRTLSCHSPRDSGARRMCCSSWQMAHFCSVSVDPGPDISRSCASPSKENRRTSARNLALNNYSDPVPAVPEVAERVPRRHGGLRVAAVVPGAREDRQVAALAGLELVGEAAPRVLVAGSRELRAVPAPALVGGNLDLLDGAFADPRAAAHQESF